MLATRRRMLAAHGSVGMRRAMAEPMGNTQRELLALRAIVVSARAALRKTPGADDRETIKNRITELLAELEETVVRNGADAVVLALLDEARRGLWDEASTA